MWCTKFRPQSLDDLDLHPAAQSVLNALAICQNLPHIVFCGPAGSGRHTRALCLLKKIFNINVLNPIASTITYTHLSTQSEMTVIASPVHLEINPSMVGVQDASVVTSVIKEAATTRSVNSQFKVIFIQQADRLSQLAQQALRRLMEEHARTCKLFLFCENSSGLIAPIRSRAFTIRLQSIQQQEMLEIAQSLQTKLRLSFPTSQVERIACEAEGNLRRFLLLLQAFHVTKEASGQVEEILPKWEVQLNGLLNKYFTQKSPLDSELRKGLVEILKQGVPAEEVLYKAARHVIAGTDNCKFAYFVLDKAAEYDARLRSAQIGLIHLEAFLCVVLHSMSMLGGQ